MRNLTLIKKVSGILLFVCFCSLNVFAQELCNVRVKVLDAESKKIIEDADIQIIHIGYKFLYKPNGLKDNTIFENLTSGNISIAAEKENYELNFLKISFDCENLDKSNSKILEIYLNKKKSGNNSKSSQKDRSNSPLIIGTKNPDEVIPNEGIVYLGKPSYPKVARLAKVSGQVRVQVVIDYQGDVIYAKAISGDPLFKDVTERAAVSSKFKTTTLEGKPIMIMGIIVYNFVA